MTRSVLPVLALTFGLNAHAGPAASAPASATKAKEPVTECVLMRQPGGRYSASLMEVTATSDNRRVSVESSGVLLLKDTATKFFEPGKTGTFESYGDSLIPTGSFTPVRGQNALEKFLGLPGPAPDPLTYSPHSGRFMQVTVTGWKDGTPQGTCQRMQSGRKDDRPHGSPVPITGFSDYQL